MADVTFLNLFCIWNTETQGRSSTCSGGSATHVTVKRNERGSQAVEAGLVILPCLGLFFLLFDICWAIFIKTTFQHAVREGVRYAITGRTGVGGQDASIKSVVKYYSLGLAPDANIAIRYYTPDTFTVTPNNSTGNIAEVSIEGYTHYPITSLLKGSGPSTITVRSSDRVEPSPGGIPPTR